MCVIIKLYYEGHGMEYKDYLEGRREGLTPEGLSIYREACRQQNAISGGVFGPLAKVDTEDIDGLREHDRLIGVAEALTSHPFEPISPEHFEAAMIEYDNKDKPTP